MSLALGTIGGILLGYVLVAIPSRLLISSSEKLRDSQDNQKYLELFTMISILEVQISELEEENSHLLVTQRLWDSLPENRKNFL